MNITSQKPYSKGTKRKPKRENDAKYLAWLRKQPSALNGAIPCVVAHVRRAHNSGVAIKPLFSSIPLTYDQHNAQHWYGEAGCLNRYIPKLGFWDNYEAKIWFDKKAEEYLKLWKRSIHD